MNDELLARFNATSYIVTKKLEQNQLSKEEVAKLFTEYVDPKLELKCLDYVANQNDGNTGLDGFLLEVKNPQTNQFESLIVYTGSQIVDVDGDWKYNTLNGLTNLFEDNDVYSQNQQMHEFIDRNASKFKQKVNVTGHSNGGGHANDTGIYLSSIKPKIEVDVTTFNSAPTTKQGRDLFEVFDMNNLKINNYYTNNDVLHYLIEKFGQQIIGNNILINGVGGQSVGHDFFRLKSTSKVEERIALLIEINEGKVVPIIDDYSQKVEIDENLMLFEQAGVEILRNNDSIQSYFTNRVQETLENLIDVPTALEPYISESLKKNIASGIVSAACEGTELFLKATVPELYFSWSVIKKIAKIYQKIEGDVLFLNVVKLQEVETELRFSKTKLSKLSDHLQNVKMNYPKVLEDSYNQVYHRVSQNLYSRSFYEYYLQSWSTIDNQIDLATRARVKMAANKSYILQNVNYYNVRIIGISYAVLDEAQKQIEELANYLNMTIQTFIKLDQQVANFFADTRDEVFEVMNAYVHTYAIEVGEMAVTIKQQLINLQYFAARVNNLNMPFYDLRHRIITCEIEKYLRREYDCTELTSALSIIEKMIENYEILIAKVENYGKGQAIENVQKRMNNFKQFGLFEVANTIRKLKMKVEGE